MRKIFYLIICLLISLSAWADTHWIDPNGSAGSWAACQSETEPGGLSGHCTLTQANTYADAGDTIRMQGGTYSGQINPADRDGSEGSPITWIAVTGETPIIDNGGSPAVWIEKDEWHTFDGLKFQNCATYDKCVDAAPDTPTRLKGAIIFQNCTFVGRGMTTRAIDGLQVLNSTFTSMGGYGIVVNGSPSYKSTNTRIEGNTFSGSAAGSDMVTIHESGGGPAGDYHLIKDNTFTMTGGENAIDITSGRYIVADGNTTSGGCSQLILIGSGSSSATNVLEYVRIVNHKAYNSGTGGNEHVYIGGELNTNMGKIQILRSEFYGTGEHNIRSGAENTTTILRVFHNILDARHLDDTPAFQIQNYITDVEAKNNIFVIASGDYAQSYTDINDCEDSDYNLYYHTSGTGYDLWSNGPSTLAEIYSNYGHEQHGIDGNPSFVDLGNRDYSLQSGSSAINSGGYLTTITSATNLDPGATSFVVNDPYYFYDGWNIGAGESWAETGDVIKTSAGQTATITAINYSTKTITVNSAITWTQGDGIGLTYQGSAPDIGAYEYDLFIRNALPIDNATDVGPDTDISWDNPTGYTSVDVYFEEVVGACDLQVGDKVVSAGDVNSYDPGTMSEETEYCWRVDVNHSGGTETGVEMSFTTGSEPPPPSTDVNILTMKQASGGSAVKVDSGGINIKR